MTIESATYISQLNPALPADGDEIPEGDNQIRLIKDVLQSQFPSLGAAAMTATAAQLNDILNKSLRAGDTYTGTHAFAGATAVTVPTRTVGDNTVNAASTAYVMAAVAAATGGTGLLALTVSNAAAVSLVNGQHDCGTYTGGAITWTLPATPSAGHTVAITPCNDRIDNVIARNGNNIMGLAEDMTINSANVTVTLRYVNASAGWRLA